MKSFIFKNSLNILAVTGGMVAIYTAMSWSAMPVLQRMAGLIFIALVVHAWEEYRFPGGFMEMETRHLNITFPRPEINELVLVVGILCLGLVPLFFPHVVWLTMAPMLLFIGQFPGHIGAVKRFKLERFYSPGLVTAVLMQPIPIYSIIYVVQNKLMHPVEWLFSIVYAGIVMAIGSIIIIRMNGRKVFEFIKNARAAKHPAPKG
ncbi:MAG: HXXEE domain-containing protein [Desulfatitalea sp.]|nr:HXXEE domain-containing protein [Desulfatitalea sp.]NNJ99139.1 HXXEE domain-containing protein [Desulfatitalea sp.]